MSRPENRMVMGYFAIEPKHHAALVSLVQPATPATRLLDPCAGEGEFLQVAAQAWQMTPYANELDGERAAQCLERFGATQAVRGDLERLNASNGAFGVLWVNPPYDYDSRATQGNKRVELRHLRHAWKWAQVGGVVFWVVYDAHISEEAASFLAKHSRSVEVWALEGKHLGEYDQRVVVAIKGEPTDAPSLYEQILVQKAEPRPLTVQAEPRYKAPAPRPLNRFVFAAEVVDEVQGGRLIEAGGAWRTPGFQSLLAVPPPLAQIEPVVAPRPGHMALVLAAGVANGAVIHSQTYGRVALRGKTRTVEQIARVEVEADPHDPEQQVKKTTLRLKPTTTLTLLAEDGTQVQMDGDDALLDFIRQHKAALVDTLNRRFKPLYNFDMNGLGAWLNRIRLKGKHPLYTAQKHVIGALTRGLQSRKSLLLAGQMGVGKTALAGAVAIAVGAGLVPHLSPTHPDQVTLVVSPPHLMKKWKRELLSIHPSALVEQLDRHEQVKAFMERAELLGAKTPKIGLIKRDLTKLGSPREVAVRWRWRYRALWGYGTMPPLGYEDVPRLKRERVPHCPQCGAPILQESKGTLSPASEEWLKGGKRNCQQCLSPLWQEGRDASSKPRAGEKYPLKNPRVRLDQYLKRHYPERVYLLIWDEAHEAANSDAGNGESFGRMANLAHKVLALTGTPFNGRASSMFNLQYHLNPRVRERFNWGGAPRLNRKVSGGQAWQAVLSEDSKQRGRAESRWVEAMGVLEQVIEERPQYDQNTGAYTGTSTYERPYSEAPGISPLLIAEVLDQTVFFSLGDLGKYLPRFEEIALPVSLDADVQAEYDLTRQYLKDYLIQRRWEGDSSFRGSYLQWSMGWVVR